MTREERDFIERSIGESLAGKDRKGLVVPWRGILTSLPGNVSTVQYSTVQYSTVQYSTVQYSTVQYSTVQYSTVQYSTVQYSTVLVLINEGKYCDPSVF